MLVLIAFAFVSGVITILSPCILPVLPIVLSGSVGGGRARPLGIIAAFVVSFTVFTLALSAIVQAIGVSPDALRIVAVVLLIIFGLVMFVPALRDRFELLTSRLANRRQSAGQLKTPARRGGAESGTGAAAGKGASASWTGFWSGIPVGFSLGLVWTPCVGPIMASVISLALTQHVDSGSVFITLAYSIGTSIPMLAIMFGGRTLIQKFPALKRNSGAIQKVFGVLMIVVGVAIAFGWDRRVQTALLQSFPTYGSGLTAVEQNSAVQNAIDARGAKGTTSGSGSTTADMIASADSAKTFSGATGAAPENARLMDYGLAPDILSDGAWFNTAGIVNAGADATETPAATATIPASGTTAAGESPPLTMKDLRGKVVVVDFWTYSCVNCIRTIPYLRQWYQAYHDKGLVIIGVHTPEFEFEKSTANVAAAIKDLGVTWPVVQDNNYREWNAYGNRFWPAHYFIDANGHVRYYHFGEGEYATSEKVIQELLKERGAKVNGQIVSKPSEVNNAQTPETYLGYDRGRGFASSTPPVEDVAAQYGPPPDLTTPANGQWYLRGTWTIYGQYIQPEGSGELTLGFNAGNVFMVIAPGSSPSAGPATVEVRVDGKPPADTTDVKNGVVHPAESRLYQLVGLTTPGAHTLTLKVTGHPRFYAFTFG